MPKGHEKEYEAIKKSLIASGKDEALATKIAMATVYSRMKERGEKTKGK